MKVRFFSNIPSPYRVEFFNLLGEKVDLEVIFEAEKAPLINEDWYVNNTIKNFKAIFLKKGVIEEKKINLKILKYVKRDTDILVFTNYSYFTEMVALLCAKIKRIEYALVIDGGIIRKNESYLKRVIKKSLVSGAKLYLSPSNSSDDFLIFYGAKKERIHWYPFTSLKKSEILTNPISVNEKLYLKNEFGIFENKVILSVGQFIYRKGYDWMLESYKDLNSDIGIYIVGGKPPKEYLNLKKRYNMDNLHFVEFQNKESIIKWYKIADLFVLPTREDIWGLVINEAMSQGLPVITTDNCIAGLEMIENGENGFIVKVEDCDDLYKKTNLILENSTYYMQSNNINKSTIYTLENMVEKTFLALERIRCTVDD